MNEKKYDFSKIEDQQEFEILPEEERQVVIEGAQEEAERINKSPLREAYELLGVHTSFELQELFSVEDQKLMRSHEWDYKNSDLVINKVRDILEAADPEKLTEEERKWQQEILRRWYHHAMSWANVLYKDREKAKEFAEKALEIMGEDEFNKTTRLYYLLLQEKLEEAEEWAKGITDEDEKEWATTHLDEYKRGEFF